MGTDRIKAGLDDLLRGLGGAGAGLRRAPRRPTGAPPAPPPPLPAPPATPRGPPRRRRGANPRFASRLRHLVRSHPALATRGDQVRVHHTLVEHLDVDRSYDVIVSGLPFTNFTPAQVETIMNRYLELLHPGGTLTYFAYRGTRYARALAAPTEARRHRAVEELLAHYHRRYATGCWSVWGNLPPARVWQLRRPATRPGTKHHAAAGRPR
ncbi:translation initiation factor IF-2 [Streptomyces sp. NPDC059810]|uniref:translation initiation factor IF-2 n=1 Tax=Streptomyces sp. NPDC059810 TaxID=3346956 RepID=UPI003662F455